MIKKLSSTSAALVPYKNSNKSVEKNRKFRKIAPTSVALPAKILAIFTVFARVFNNFGNEHRTHG